MFATGTRLTREDNLARPNDVASRRGNSCTDEEPRRIHQLDDRDRLLTKKDFFGFRKMIKEFLTFGRYRYLFIPKFQFPNHSK